jgi:hypothetical protein
LAILTQDPQTGHVILAHLLYDLPGASPVSAEEETLTIGACKESSTVGGHGQREYGGPSRQRHEGLPGRALVVAAEDLRTVTPQVQGAGRITGECIDRQRPVVRPLSYLVELVGAPSERWGG